MIKPQVWILNSSLIMLFVIVLLISKILEQVAPKLKIKPTIKIEEIQKKKLPVVVNLDKIIKNDIFDTFIEPLRIPPTKKSLITPIPTLPQAMVTPTPEPQKQEFVDPLPIKLKGIILSSDELNNIVMIEDETQKENIYHLGEKIKDAQIIKISRNKLVLLRANGQQETLTLRKEEDLLAPMITTEQEKWKYIVKKVDEQNYEIDPKELKKEIVSLGEFIETLNLGTAYTQGTPTGIKINKVDPNEIGAMLGLQQNDIISSINNISIIDIKNRIKVYDSISEMKKGDNIQLVLKRNNIDSIINYKLATLEKPKKKTFIQPAVAPPPVTGAAPPPLQPPQPGLPPSRAQQREETIRDFRQQHAIDERHRQTIADIRQRLLEKLRQRSPNVRVR